MESPARIFRIPELHTWTKAVGVLEPVDVPHEVQDPPERQLAADSDRFTPLRSPTAAVAQQKRRHQTPSSRVIVRLRLQCTALRCRLAVSSRCGMRSATVLRRTIVKTPYPTLSPSQAQ